MSTCTTQYMASQVSPMDQIRYRYHPWAASSGPSYTSTPAEHCSPRQFSTHANSLSHNVASPAPVFDAHHATDFEAYSMASRFALDSNDRTAMMPSPQPTMPHRTSNASTGCSSYYSPSNSGSSYSSGDSRTFSDLPSTSWASPDMGVWYSPQPSMPRSSVDSTVAPSLELLPNGSCALSDVQQFAEPDPDVFPFESTSETFNGAHMAQATSIAPLQINVHPAEHMARHPFDQYDVPQTAFQMERQESTQSDNTSNSISFSSQDKVLRHKHRQSLPSPRFSPARVTKRIPNPRRLSAPANPSPAESQRSSPSRSSRSSQGASNFPCPLAPYGCTSCFGSKNEWKRHVNTQHLRLDMWRCDQCNDRDTRPNDFNRKDLFIQHLRRMHHRSSDGDGSARGKGARQRTLGSDDADPAVAAAEQRCHIRLRSPPSHSSCLFCSTEFEGPGSWEERMEHIGRHLEQDRKEGKDAPAVPGWRHDEDVEAWLEQEGLISRSGYEWQIADGRRTSR